MSRDAEQKLTAQPDFQGPTDKRKCTDILCTIIIVLAWGLLTILGIYAIKHGDYRVVLYPMDYDGNICGLSNYSNIDMSDYKYLYPVNFYGGGVCVKECPDLSDLPSGDPVDLHTLVTYSGIFQTESSILPQDYIQVANYNSTNTNNSEVCTMMECYPGDNVLLSWKSPGVNEGAGYAFYAVNTRTYMNRCLLTSSVVDFLRNETSSLEDFAKQSNSNLEGTENVMSNLYSDLFTSRSYILGFGLGLSVIVGFIYSYFLRIPGVLALMVWGSILSAISLIAGIGYYAHTEVRAWENEDPKAHSDGEIQMLQILAYLVWGVGGVLVLLMCALRKRIQLAIGVVKEAAKSISAMPLLVAFPIFQCLGLLLFLLIWLVYSIHLASLGTLVPATIEMNDIAVTYRSFEYDEITYRAGWYFLFMFLWTSEFIMAMGEIIIAMSVAKWFFSRDKSEIGNSTVLDSITDSLIYHTGTAAFGSLIIAIITTIRIFLAYIQKRAKNSGSKVAQAVMCCLQCCMWCLEKFIKFVNKNAYIQTAIFATSFCKSAQNAFVLILRNAARVGTLTLVSEVVVIVGKLFICTITAGLSYFVIDHYLSEDLYSPVGPVIFILILSYFSGSMFMNVFTMAVGTILMCFIADEEMFDTEESYSSKGLRAWVDSNGERKIMPGGK
eukprot:CAMPEP_0194355902 /NCGR_PEP_ID=MMETSP0174-20130528/3750_1 /TAXON_ID=216777 /ORGANISM="Proboscia alata, Strain PI-D3" /LENGTH=665 /DNA_ID=CAMNT_0039125365 /DNA_START=68 /DNA_END=2065 /DNA_ORIENTATION=+